jgi:4-hydroxy-tetrahydrodipicolinate synthase
LANEFENIAATKEASGTFRRLWKFSKSAEKFSSLLRRRRDDSAFNRVGADGLVSVCSNEIPKETAAMVEKALSGAWTSARRIHYKILALMEANFTEASPAPCKFVMQEMGLLEENLRLPLVPVTESARRKLREILKVLER